MRGGQSTASETSSPCATFATIRGVAKKQTFNSAHTKRVVKKSKRLSSDNTGLFNKTLRLFAYFFSSRSINRQSMRKRYRQCAI
ncbi:hypothetical protein DNK65_20890 [Citrobacter koseri]|nr:hypothetical protein MC77_009260 [Citrobacter koseri]PYZ80530.1 hypothetical protein DNK65_20890 [Citrobacter koseri]